MEQLKKIFAVVKKYHFWILCLLILGVYLGMWFMATSNMSEETDARVSEINTAFDKGQAIQGVVNHPNPKSIEMMGQLTKLEAEQVRRAWERRYREQEDVLVWPGELKPDFIAAVEKLMPIETKVEFPAEKEQLKLEFRNRYRDYIREEMPGLADIIGARWQVSTAASAGGAGDFSGGEMGGAGMGGLPGTGMGPEMGMGMGMGLGPGGGGYDDGEMGAGYRGDGRYRGRGEERKPVVVQWSPQNQSQLLANSFYWVRPTTLQVLYAQEDLWVLRALLMIIKETNGDADAQYNAAVKEIMTINLGRSARGIKSVGRVKMPGAGGMDGMGGPGGAGGLPGMEMEMGLAPGLEGGGDEFGTAPGGDASGALAPGLSPGMESGEPRMVDPADYRYVDDEMEPLTGDDLRTAMQSTSPSDAFLVVAKRMPVRLRVKMDIRKLPLLLCECANSDLPVEVRQVRINAPPGTGSSGGGYGGMSGGAPGMGAGGMDFGMGGGMDVGLDPGAEFGGGYPGMDDGAMGQTTRSPYNAEVELYGLVYIYNPVDPEKLGMEESSGEGEAASFGQPAPGGATTPAAGVVSEAEGAGTKPAAAGGATPAGGEAAKAPAAAAGDAAAAKADSADDAP